MIPGELPHPIDEDLSLGTPAANPSTSSGQALGHPYVLCFGERYRFFGNVVNRLQCL